ncbi:MAG: hypothetical protein ACI9H8_002128 [Lysobacterales bacterium]|jgi:hypothetical protein
MKINEAFRMMHVVLKGKFMFNNFIALCIGLLILLPDLSYAQFTQDAETWERDAAWRASASVNTQTQKNKLQSLLKAGDDEASLILIQEIQREENWPTPARERVIYEYVSSLRQEAPHVVGDDLIAYLQNYQSTVFVAHEDHPSGNVPLFNIKGAAAGVVNGWARQEAAFQGAVLVQENPDSLSMAYLSETSLPKQQGLLDSLNTASPIQLKAISSFALESMEAHPELISVAARSALINLDLNVLMRLAESGQGPEMHVLFRGSTKRLDKAQNLHLLQAALRNPSRGTAALAIAQLAPGLAGVDASEELLLETLGDPELGSSAALALVINPRSQLLQKLQVLAVPENNQLTAIRARLALQIYASRLTAEAQ